MWKIGTIKNQKMQRQSDLSHSLRLLMLSLGILLIATAPGFAQDTIDYHLSTHLGIASQNYLPHWLTANRFGILNDQNHAVGLLRGGVETKHQFTKQLSVGAGIDLMAKIPFTEDQSSQFWLQQGYVTVQYGIFELSGGRMERTLGTPDSDLSTGSLALSGNARPIPQILLSVPEFSAVPFTKGYVEFKGTYAHGWLGEDRHVRNPYLHEKSLYVRFGGPWMINVAGGLIHTTIWGGEVANIKLPSGLADYWDVVLARSANEAFNPGGILDGEIINALGDNMGVYDLNVLFKTKNYHFLVYQQTPFEDKSGNNPFNKDRLLGINVVNQRSNAWLSSIVYEFVTTKHQSGPSRPGGVDDGPGSKDRFGLSFGGRDNYYNNYLYKTGWVYQNRIIGTPLFYTLARTRLYFPDFVEPDLYKFNFNVVNNRVVAHHVGVSGNIKKVSYKFLSTFTRNFGTYGGLNGGITEWGSVDQPDAPYAFRPPKHQSYFLLEVESHPFSNHWSLLTSVAADVGELTNNIGILVGLKRQGLLEIK